MKKFARVLLSVSMVFVAAVSFAETLSLEKQWEVSGVSQPESVLSIPAHEWLYVSNVNGEEEDGFISRLSKDGKIETLKWVEGIHTPTGMGYYEGHIYVADQTQVHVIDVEAGKIVKTLPSEAKTLNDISVSEDGQVFVSDLTTGSIYVSQGDELVLWIKSTDFLIPNGVLVQGENLIVGSVGTVLSQKLTPDQYGSLYKVSLADKSVQLIEPSDKIGLIDGVVSYKDGVILSDPISGNLYYVTEEQKVVVGTVEGGVADIWMDAESQILYAPMMFGNGVAAYRISTEDWTRITSEADYLEQCADNYYGDEGGKSVASKDGKISGNFGGQELSGSWEWKDEYFCRSSKLGDMDLGSDCLVIEVTDSKMRLTLEEGNGISVVYDKQ